MAESEKPEGAATGSEAGPGAGKKPSMRPRKTLDLTAQEVNDPVSAADAPSGADAPPGEADKPQPPSDTIDPGVTPAVWPDAASSAVPPADAPPAESLAPSAAEPPSAEPPPAQEAPALERPASEPAREGGTGIVPLAASAVAGAVLAVLAVAVMDQAGVIGRSGGDVAGLERRVSDLEARAARPASAIPAPAAPAADPALGQRLGALEKTVGDRGQSVEELRKGLDGLRADLARLSQQGQAQAQAPAAPDLQPRLDDLDRKISALSEQLAAQGGRIDEARRSAEAAAERARAVDPAALEAARAELSALKARVDQREAQAPAPREARAAAGLAAVTALKESLDRGAPIGEAVASVKRLFPDADTKPLDTLPPSAAPTLKALGEALARDLAGVPLPAPSADAGVMDRLGSSLSRLVKVTRAPGTAEPTGGGADAARTRVIQRLDRGDYRGALEAWNGLDDAAKQATSGARTALAARLAAEDTIDSLRRAALSAFGTGGKP